MHRKMLFWKRDFYPVKYGNLGYPSLKPGAGEIIPTNFQIQSFQNVPLFCEGMGEKTCFKSTTTSWEPKEHLTQKKHSFHLISKFLFQNYHILVGNQQN